MASTATDRPSATAAPTYAKHFIPLESNPDVFNKLIRHLGASESLQFEDVWSLDEPHLEHPSVALILVFPTTEDYEAKRDAEYRERGVYGADGDNENALWLKQTIQNACGLYGILHALMNGEARGFINPETTLSRLFTSCSSLPPQKRPNILEDSDELEEAYNKVARDGTSAAPENPEDEVYHHYVCFVKSHRNGRLYELDGDRAGPIDRGDVLGPDEDMLAPGALRVVREYVEREKGSPFFSLMALVKRG